MAKKHIKPENKGEDEKFPLPIYNKEDDIYNKAEGLPLNNEELPSDKQHDLPQTGMGNDLDIPGAELDDADEAVGEEDEENNYYSLGGDNHEDLENDRE